ncbi:hypothetical protein ACFSBZ_09575 [Amnibacterium flavum]|uniref:Uncharacterized protein n=1 Tax=Amnibacterium flavum TaxID=2173173 RepID=A0A2V1HR62_9MICO|nr:hypothetical protein [Amnibacterium flavum]PVZ95106.1 hypothetical protein DDQ50_00815 [Amnibacterium flavum]
MQKTAAGRTRRAISIIGALALIAGIAGVGTVASGAWFTATKSASASVTGALLTIGEIGKTSDQKTVAVADVYPMTDDQAAVSARSEWVTVRNTGTIPLDWTMSIVNPQATAPLTAAQLANFRFRLYDEAGTALTAPLTLGAMPATVMPAGFQTRGSALAAGGQTKVELRVWLSAESQNEFQGARAAFNVVINGIQNGAGGFPSIAQSLTAVKSGQPAGASTALSWTDVSSALASSGISGAPTYTVERADNPDFAGSSVVYSGIGTTASDDVDGAPVLPDGQPGNVLMGSEARSIALGGSTACARLADSSVSCWGKANGVERGPGVWYQSMGPTAPVRLTGTLANTYAVGTPSVDDWGDACSIVLDGGIHCRGGYSGNGNLSTEPWPVSVTRTSPLSNDSAAELTQNYLYGGTCFVTNRGKVGCWGHPHYGAIGSFSDQGVPINMSTGSLATRTVRHITSAVSVTCASATDNTISCWGTNLNGSLGNGGAGTVTNPRVRTTLPAEYDLKGTTTPVLVDTSMMTGQGISSIVGGQNVVCALTGASNVYCWGKLGSWKDFGGKPTKVDTGSLTNISQIAVTASGLCALQEGNVYCWGTDVSGELGFGSAQTKNTPTKLTSGILATQSVTQLVAQNRDTCVLTSAGSVSCWGSNQWGVADYNKSGTAVRVAGDKTVSTVNTATTCGTANKIDANRCSLRTDGAYYYRVSYTVAGVSGWTSPFVRATRS